jgi:hypothetical protein
MTFKEWFLEMGDYTTADTSSVVFDRNFNDDLAYDFEVNSTHYQVYFSGPKKLELRDAIGNPVLIAQKKYAVGFTSGESYALKGNTKVPTAVYGEVFKGLRKLIEQENPDALNFSGWETKQDAMYNLFYTKYLSKAFTRISGSIYLRNDLYNKYREENGKEWKVIERIGDLHSSAITDKLQNAKNIRDREREQRRLAAKTGNPPPPQQSSWGDLLW